MPKQVLWTSQASRALDRLDSRTRERILNAVEQFAAMGQGNWKQLHGVRNVWRLRVGEWRVIFRFERHRELIVIADIRSRGGAYKP